MEGEKGGGWDWGKADKQKSMGWRGMNEEVVDSYNSFDFIVRRGKCGATRIETGIYSIVSRLTIDLGCFVYP